MEKIKVPMSVVFEYEQARGGAGKDSVVRKFAEEKDIDFYKAENLIRESFLKKKEEERVIVSPVLKSEKKKKNFRWLILVFLAIAGFLLFFYVSSLPEAPVALATKEFNSFPPIRGEVIEFELKRESPEFYELICRGHEGILIYKPDIFYNNDIIVKEKVVQSLDDNGNIVYKFPYSEGYMQISFEEAYLLFEEQDIGNSTFLSSRRDAFPFAKITASTAPFGDSINTAYVVTASKNTTYVLNIDGEVIEPYFGSVITNSSNSTLFIIPDGATQGELLFSDGTSYTLVKMPRRVTMEQWNSLTSEEVEAQRVLIIYSSELVYP